METFRWDRIFVCFRFPLFMFFPCSKNSKSYIQEKLVWNFLKSFLLFRGNSDKNSRCTLLQLDVEVASHAPKSLFPFCFCLIWSGMDPEILKRWMGRGEGYMSVTMKILGFRWSKKAQITLETIGFWQNISIIRKKKEKLR